MPFIYDWSLLSSDSSRGFIPSGFTFVNLLNNVINSRELFLWPIHKGEYVCLLIADGA